MINVQAIIITYHPDLEIIEANIKQLLQDPALSTIHIIDNTPIKTDFRSLSSKQVLVHILGDNKGIAYAQNVGIQLASNSGANYIVLFDQDSSLKSNLVSGLLSAMEEAKAAQIKLACIGPRIFDTFSGKKSISKVQPEKAFTENITLCRQIIASGKLIDVDALHVIGLMESSLFIDGVDHEWCWRASKYGYQVAIAERVVMKHTLGDAHVSLLGINYRVYPPIRMYYQFRNALVLLPRGYVPLYSKLRGLVNIVFGFLVFGIIRSDSDLRRKYMLHGIIDGIVKRMGSFKPR